MGKEMAGLNYIREINAFYDWLETNALSDSAINLWHALMHINNKTGWLEEFSVALSTLQLKTGLKKDAVILARKRLQEAGRITSKSRSGQQSAMYSIVPFTKGYKDCVGLTDTNCDTNPVTNPTQTPTQSATLTPSITKLNKTKTKQNKIYTPDSQEYILSQYLFKKMLENNPTVKEPDLNKWAINMDKLLRLDNRPSCEVMEVIDFCQSDTFWKSNILSVAKLREKYDQLNIKRKSSKPTNNYNHSEMEGYKDAGEW